MPGRKSGDVSAVPRVAENGDDGAAAAKAAKSSELGVEDLNLPRSIINRLSKGKLPPNTQIQKDALLAISKSATVFVSYLANSANERASVNGKKTIQTIHVLEALAALEFEGFAPQCEAETTQYTKAQSDKRNNYRQRVKEDKTGPSADASEVARQNGQMVGNGGENYYSDASVTPAANGHSRNDSPPATKKARRDSNASDEEMDNDDTISDGEEEEEQSDGEDDQSNEDGEDAEEGPDGDVDEPVEIDDARLQMEGDDDDEGGSESD